MDFHSSKGGDSSDDNQEKYDQDAADDRNFELEFDQG